MKRRKDVVELVSDIIGIIAVANIFVMVKLVEMSNINITVALIVGLVSCGLFAAAAWVTDYLEK